MRVRLAFGAAIRQHCDPTGFILRLHHICAIDMHVADVVLPVFPDRVVWCAHSFIEPVQLTLNVFVCDAVHLFVFVFVFVVFDQSVSQWTVGFFRLIATQASKSL